MTRAELIEKIRKGTDIMLKIGDNGFTICDSMDYENGKDIAAWGGKDAKIYPDAESLVDQYFIDGKSLGERADEVKITDYTLNGEV